MEFAEVRNKYTRKAPVRMACALAQKRPVRMKQNPRRTVPTRMRLARVHESRTTRGKNKVEGTSKDGARFALMPRLRSPEVAAAPEEVQAIRGSRKQARHGPCRGLVPGGSLKWNIGQTV